MKINLRFPLILLFIFFFAKQTFATSPNFGYQATNDTTEVIKLNNLGFNSRLVDAEQTVRYAEKALAMATALNYPNGIGEAYRIKGIGKSYQNQLDSAVAYYSKALTAFANNQEGKARVYNNMGGVYRDIDNDQALEFYGRSFKIAKALKMKELVAGLSLNIGIIFQNKHEYEKALAFYQTSNEFFTKLDNPTGIASSLQSISSIYKDRKEWANAERYALGAIQKAKEFDLHYIIATTNLTLSLVYVAESRYYEAEQSIAEGITYSRLIKNQQIEHDYVYRYYQLYSKQKNYEKALGYLVQVHLSDSSRNEDFESGKIKVLLEQNKRSEKEKENQVLKERENTNKILFWASLLVFGLLIVVIALLVKNVGKKTQTNKKLTELNHEIFLQKETVDRVNHNLEEIIDERTRDLKVKNKKLSEYSSHLSHQIRGPVATLKGLMNLNKEGLIEKDEVIQQMEKCVNDIDDKILRINDMLHDPLQNGFNSTGLKDSDTTPLK